ncbi:hypothetical protein DERF_007448 [Dermatophagoides farinae]|uniref:Uncharacterized protein n=1 Tax=Dermatophagoides farinae TaxID=6954 RepID=A0A922HY72_DERFA|nr:hypothetical protein DERF_007448 [Dermatophagoides farinae]
MLLAPMDDDVEDEAFPQSAPEFIGGIMPQPVFEVNDESSPLPKRPIFNAKLTPNLFFDDYKRNKMFVNIEVKNNSYMISLSGPGIINDE